MSTAFPLHELRSLLAPGAGAAPGVVVTVKEDRADIATPQGLRVARIIGRAIHAGERVVVRDGVAYPAARAERRYVL
jgi:hypothetical protein